MRWFDRLILIVILVLVLGIFLELADTLILPLPDRDVLRPVREAIRTWKSPK